MLKDAVQTRAIIAEKFFKNPNIEDYKLAIRNFDHVHLAFIMKWVDNLYKMYLLVNDHIHKNNENAITKIYDKRKKSNSRTTVRNKIQ